ncbi:MAG: hypothetical protein WBD22_00510, partial [Pyrinomonadaceae bacterium]
MERPETAKKRRGVPWVLGGLVLISLVLLVLLQSSNLWRNLSVDTASDTLLLYALSSLNFIAFVIFGFIFLRSIIKLGRERRALKLGSKIKTRLLLYFAAISLLPIVAMAAFSYLFMNRALERWFSQIPENVFREIQSQAAADQAAELLKAGRMLAASLEGKPITQNELDEIAVAGDLSRLSILAADNSPIVVSGRPI